MVKTSVVIILGLLIKTISAMPRSYSTLESRSLNPQQNNLLSVYKTLSSFLQNSNSIAPTPADKPAPPTKRARLSINQELSSLAHLLILRENKRREAEEIQEIQETRSRLLSIGKRSEPRENKFHDISGFQTESQDLERETIPNKSLQPTPGHSTVYSLNEIVNKKDEYSSQPEDTGSINDMDSNIFDTFYYR